MKRFGVEVNLKNIPCLDKEFMPILRFNRAFLANAKKPFSVAVERADGQMATCHTFIHGTEEMKDADCYYIERLVKTILWMKGGFKVYVSGDETVYNYLKDAYCAGGVQEFDWDFMSDVFEQPFQVVYTDKVLRLWINPSPWAAIWTAAASALTRAAPTGRCPPWWMAKPSTPRRWSGSPRSTPTPSTIMTASWPP